MNHNAKPSTLRVLLTVIAAILAFWALRAAAAVAIPVVIASLLCVALAPLDDRLSAKLPRPLQWIGRAVIMIGLLAVIAIFVAGLVFAAQQLLGQLPDLSKRVEDWITSAERTMTQAAGDSALGTTLDQFGGALSQIAQTAGGAALDAAGRVAEMLLGATGGFLAGVIIVFFLVLLGLSEARAWTCKIDAITDDPAGRAWHQTIAVASTRLRRFVVVRSVIGILTAALYTGWLAIFGIDLLVVWAVLALLLTFIPNLGSVVSGSLPALYALMTAEFWTAVTVAAGLFVIEQVVGNYIDPRLQGRQIALSPLGILVSLLFWGWLWGAAGALLAVPVTMTITVALAQSHRLRPLALILSNRSDPEALRRDLCE